MIERNYYPIMARFPATNEWTIKSKDISYSSLIKASLPYINAYSGKSRIKSF